MSRLILAIPSKGRLQEASLALLDEAGLAVQSAGGKLRDYTGTIGSLDGVDVQFMQAAEIIQALGEGAVHLGVTGEDLLREGLDNPDAKAQVLMPLGFGHADLVIAVPRAWIDVETVADLDDVCHSFVERRGRRLRVATKFMRLTRDYFARFGISDYRIVESLGATEGAPNAGSAEIIVDITSTGETLAANGLKILRDGVMLKSQACLIASRGAPWQGAATKALHQIIGRVQAVASAKKLSAVAAFGGDPAALDKAARTSDGVTVLAAGQFTVPKSKAAALAEALRAAGADYVTSYKIDALHQADGHDCAAAFLQSL
jgi:ATP phosphoribosyltransferase